MNASILTAAADLQTASLLASLAQKTFFEAYAAKAPARALEEYIQSELCPAKLHTQLNDPSARFFLAFSDEELVGYAKIVLNAWIDMRPDTSAVYFERNYVDQRFQGQGIGTKLFEERLSLAQSLGHKRGWLRVWDQHAEGIRFHLKNGFEPHDTRSFCVTLGDGSMYRDTDLVMVRGI